MSQFVRGVLLSLVCLSLIGTADGAEPDAADSWWSFQPLREPDVPELSLFSGGDTGDGREFTAIDRFIIAAQREKGLTLSPEADRRTLIRRLYFDLTGLPPLPEEVEAFVLDSDPDAYGKLVEQLLESPRYGERWARHWLDVVHYGETHGYDKDKPRPNAYPYRDYVIRAFNEDRPYARFVQEQLAGDVLWPHTVDGIVATGFIAAGPWDFIGHAEVPEEKIDGKVARHLDRDDMVTTTMNAFCSLTVQCAQCHHHKRDPVSMKDYYALQAVFAAIDRADREYDADPETARRRLALKKVIADLEAVIKELEASIESNKTEEIRSMEDKIAAFEKSLAKYREIEGKTRSERYGYHSQVASNQNVEKWVQVDLGRVMAVDRVALFGADEYGFADFGFPHRFRVEVSQTSDVGGDDSELLLDGSGDFPRPGASPVVIEGRGAKGRYVRITATKLWNRRQQGQAETKDWIFALSEIAVVAEGVAVSLSPEVEALDSIEAGKRWGKANVIDGIYGRYPLAERTPQGIVAWLEEDAEGQQRRAMEAMVAERDAALRARMPETLRRHGAVREQLVGARKDLGRLPEPAKVYAGTVHTGSGAFKGRGHLGGRPRPIHVLRRGDVTRPGELVRPATVAGIVPGLPAEFDLAEDHVESDRRVALAKWITHPENTLTWRSIVNRVWHYHFGRGIVDTPNDFGRLGSTPSHPELLDWLAVEFRDGGGSMKDLHRLILKSAVYKQTSRNRAEDAEIDGSNQFLWRQNRRRLEAEAIRDAVMAVAGKLDLTMYGPSFMDFVIEKPEHSPHYEYHKADPNDPATHRRSIYRFLVRSQPQPFMDTLDCADPSELVDKRGETNTALQALAMLNNMYVVRMAEFFAERVRLEEDSVRRAFALALSRQPTAEEHRTLAAYAEAHGLSATCRLIFNLNEFSFVD